MTVKVGDKLAVSVGHIIVTTTVTAVRDKLPFGVDDPSWPECADSWYDVEFLVNGKPEPQRAFKALKPRAPTFEFWNQHPR